MLYGCANQKIRVDTNMYMINHASYTYAIYNEGARLITHPLEDLRHRLARTDLPQVSDIYVISHGWNFTIAESIANYHGYIETAEAELKTIHLNDGKFVPYYIYVVWPSVTRPLGNLASAVLPYGIDDGLSYITGLVDKVVFFLPSVWKQSLNSAQIAVGNGGYPQYDHKKEFGECGPSDYGIQGDTQTSEGKDIPLALVLYCLVGMVDSPEKSQPASPDTHASSPKIHLVGHSFGGKVVSLAAAEALRLWLCRQQKDPAAACDTATTDTILPMINSTRNRPIESLVLFNAAMHIEEFTYLLPQSEQLIDGALLLELIQRKAFVFSNSDYSTGRWFDLSQIVLNNSQVQFVDHLIHSYLVVGSKILLGENLSSFAVNLVSHSPLYAVFVAPQLVWNFVTGPLEWIGSKVWYLPSDAIYHVQNHTWGETADNFLGAVRYPLNLAHFLAPLDVLTPLVVQPSDQEGILRLTMPGIGRTGLRNMVIGRPFPPFQKPSAYSIGKFADLSHAASSEMSSDTFMRISLRALENCSNNSACLVLSTRWIYSVDASKTFNTSLNPIGAHGDLREDQRSHDQRYRGCDAHESVKDISNRCRTFYFTHNFTHALPFVRAEE